MANTVRILITAKDEVSGQLDKIRDKASLLSKTDIGKGLAMGAGIAGFNALKGAALGALDAVTSYVGGSVAAFREEEVGISRLSASLAANVKGWDGNTDAIEKNIGAMVKSTGFSDGEMRDSLARLVAATKDVDKAFAIQATAMDLARFKGISLADASDALIKVEAGQYRALKGLGIVLKEGATQTEALAAVQKVAGGQMAAYADTAAGKTEILSNRLGDLQEELGSKLSPALTTATENVLGLMDAFDGASDVSFADRMFDIADAVNMINPAMWQGAITTGIFADAQKKAADEAAAAAAVGAEAWDTGSERIGTAMGNVADASGEMGDAAADARTPLRRLIDEAKKGKEPFDELRDAVASAADQMIEDKYAPEQLRLELELERGELQRNIDKLHELEKIKHPTKDQRTDITETRLEVSRGRESVEKLTSRIRTLDGEDVARITAYMNRLGRKLDWAGDEAADLLRLLKNIDNAESHVSSTGRIGGRAAGGPVAPYETTMVGEYRPELIRMGAVGGTVSPSVAGAGGGSGVSVSINVSTPVMTPGAAQALADAIAPHVTRWQQARGV